jgi:hypothetical protein
MLCAHTERAKAWSHSKRAQHGCPVPPHPVQVEPDRLDAAHVVLGLEHGAAPSQHG